MGTDNKRILIYSHDAYGMGNIRRTLLICEHLTEVLPNLSILIVTGSPVIHALRIPQKVDYIKLPCLTRDRQETFKPKYWDMSLTDLLRFRSELILSVTKSFRPDLVIVDKKPLGIKHELFQTIGYIKESLPRTRMVLGLRDILDDPATTVPIWRKRGYYDVIPKFYDAVWIYGSPGVFDAVQEYQMPPAVAAKVIYTGYLARPRSRQKRAHIRAELGLNGGLFTLVMAGGGGDGFPLLKTYVEAIENGGPVEGMETLLLAGPEMPAAHRHRLEASCSNGLPIRLEEFSDQVEGMLLAADVVVSMGGYNSTCEILSLGKKAVIVPRIHPVKEQYLRARRLAELGLINMIHPDELTPTKLLNAVETTARQKDRSQQIEARIDLHGLERVERITRKMLGIS